MQAELETQLAEFRRTGGEASLIAECGAQLGALFALQRSISTATPGALNTFRAEITAAVGAASVVAQQMRTGSSSNAVSEALQLTTATTRRELTALHADLFERRIFDRHLTFASAEDEEAYRRREAELRRYIESQLAGKTPEGDLNAAGGTIDLMLGAHAHGAGASSEFQSRWDKLIATTRLQRDALRREGRSTEEFDRNLHSSVRRFLKAKGLSDVEIDARLAVVGDPLDAVRPFMQNDRDYSELDQSVRRTSPQVEAETIPLAIVQIGKASPKDAIAAIADEAEPSPTMGDVMAKLKSAGLAAAPSASKLEVSHGLHGSEIAGVDHSFIR